MRNLTFFLVGLCIVFTNNVFADTPTSTELDENTGDGTTITTYDAFEVLLRAVFSQAELEGAFGTFNPATDSYANLTTPDDFFPIELASGDFLAATIIAKDDASGTVTNVQNIVQFFIDHPNYNVVFDDVVNPGDPEIFEWDIVYTGNPGGLPGVPIDGGLSLLAIGGIAFGLRRIKSIK